MIPLTKKPYSIKNCITLPNYDLIVLFNNNKVEILNLKNIIFNSNENENNWIKPLKDLNLFLNVKFNFNTIFWNGETVDDEGIIDIHRDQILNHFGEKEIDDKIWKDVYQ
mgnify:CR=1 FL=1